MAKNPIRSLETGAFGTALCRSEDYLTPEEKSSAWNKYFASLSPEEQASASAIIGPQFAAHLAVEWFNDMDKRTKTALDYRDVANKLSKVIDGPVDNKGKPPEKAIASDMASAANVDSLRVKIKAQSGMDEDRAASAINAALMQRARLLREKAAIKQAESDARNMAGSPQ